MTECSSVSLSLLAGIHISPVCTLCLNGWLNQDGFNRTSFPYNQFRAGINRGSAFSKCIGLPAVPLDHSGRLSDMAGLRQHLLADSYGENQYDQVEGLTNGNKWRAQTASRCIHAVRACHRSSETAHTNMFSIQQKLWEGGGGVRVFFCLENKFGLHSGCSKYFGQIAETEKK